MEIPEQYPAEQATYLLPERRRWRFRTRLLFAALATVVVAALIVGVLARAGVIFSTPRPTTSTVNYARWQAFFDMRGLFTVRMPPDWTEYGGESSGNISGSFGTINTPSESYWFQMQNAHAGDSQVLIMAALITNPTFDHDLYCQLRSLTSSTFHGFPASYNSVYQSWDFYTANAHFFIQVSDYVQLHVGFTGPTPTAPVLSAAQAAAQRTAVNGILATFQPSDTKLVTC